MTIDLSFTRDSEWIKERERLWEPRGKSLSSDFTPQQVADIKQYFMTGTPGDSYKEDAGKLGYFPLQTPEGWDYVLEHVFQESKSFEDSVRLAYQDRSDVAHLAPQELERWDYFFSEEFEPVIRSRVPVGKEQKVIELDLDPYDIFCRISAGVMGFIEKGKGGEWPKWIEKQSYYWSLFPYISDSSFNEEDNTPEGDSVYYVRRLLKNYHRINVKKPYEDPNKTRPKFLKMMEEKMDEMYSQLCPKVQQLWDEAKANRKG